MAHVVAPSTHPLDMLYYLARIGPCAAAAMKVAKPKQNFTSEEHGCSCWDISAGNIIPMS